MPPSSTGRVRALVPFFVTTPDGATAVNETLTAHPAPSAAAPLVELPVRTWDREAGVFRDAVHVVRDLPPAPPSLPKPPARLLTPAEIRAARQAAKTHPSPANTPLQQPRTPKPQKSRHRNPARSRSSPFPQPFVKTASPPKHRSTSPSSTPTKQRAFAGSTFESASPPPGGLPIPAFVRRNSPSPEPVPQPRMKDVVEPALLDPDAREQAALDLRRMLKI